MWYYIKRTLGYIKPYAKELAVGFLCVLLMSLANLALPWTLKVAVDQILTEKNRFLLNALAITILLIMLLKSIFYYGQKYLLTYVIQRMVVDLRNEVFETLQYLSMAYHEKNRVGETISRLINDINVLKETVVTTLTELISDALMITGILAMLLYLNWRLAIITILTLPSAAYAMNLFGKKMRSISRQVQIKAADITALIKESLSAIRIVKAFNREDYEVAKFAKENEHNFNVTMKSAQVEATLPPIVEFLATIGLTVILWYGGNEVINGSLTLSQFLAFMIYIGMASRPLNGLSIATNILQKSVVSMERIFEIIDSDEREEDAPDAYPIPQIQGRVELKDVWFTYGDDDKMALSDISLTVEPGEAVALVGPSGAGKSTIANLILRFYDPAKGAIYIDGHNLQEVRLDSFRCQIGLVPQETILFAGTMADNIAYGKEGATRSEIVEAAKLANAHDFIEDMAMGYDTTIGEGGIGLSGGQGQRIAIARAILRAPRILILDEATSALDVESEHLVKEALERLMEGRTTFIIAHRLSTIQNADRIVVLDKGRIVEMGTHEDLIKTDGLYSRLYKYQAEMAVGM